VHTSCDLTSRRLCKHAMSISARRSKSLSSSLTGASFAPFFLGPLLPFCFGGICAEAAAAEAEAECCSNDCKAYAWHRFWHDKLKSLKYFGWESKGWRCLLWWPWNHGPPYLLGPPDLENLVKERMNEYSMLLTLNADHIAPLER